MAATFGLDFGTTNSLVTFIGADPETGQTGPRVLMRDGRPHPSVILYSGDTPIVGRDAKDQLNELGLGVFGNIVRSPKMYLGHPVGIDVGGVTLTCSPKSDPGVMRVFEPLKGKEIFDEFDDTEEASFAGAGDCASA